MVMWCGNMYCIDGIDVGVIGCKVMILSFDVLEDGNISEQ